MKWLRMENERTTSLWIQENSRLRESNSDLLNRLQSEDLRTYHSLSTVSQAMDYTIIPRTDAGEIKQLQDMSGVGEPIYDDDSTGDDEFRDFLGDIGVV